PGSPSPGSRPTMADLSELLKEGTKESHDRAENTQFVKDFLKGNIRKELFKLATTAVLHLLRLGGGDRPEQGPPSLCPLYFPTDISGEHWEEQAQCSEATRKYVERIHEVGQNEPELLVAHAYTRYMGDLSGGQVLKKVAQRALKLPSTGEGTQFYLFENVDNAQQFKQLYRARMNALDLNLETKEKIVEEANKAFEFNMQVLPGPGGKGPPSLCPLVLPHGATPEEGADQGHGVSLRRALGGAGAVLRGHPEVRGADPRGGAERTRAAGGPRHTRYMGTSRGQVLKKVAQRA
uniref:Heme oxygenase 1 n=1 Tax=Bos mutus grunniens TaxID=30521 RepID=A0A8B9XKD7_BOSMU